MVIPLDAPKVAYLVHHGLEPVVHGLWLFTFVEDESTKFTLNCFSLGDLGHFAPLVCRLEDVSIVSRLVILVMQKASTPRTMSSSMEQD
jgi:hypothetical protein